MSGQPAKLLRVLELHRWQQVNSGPQRVPRGSCGRAPATPCCDLLIGLVLQGGRTGSGTPALRSAVVDSLREPGGRPSDPATWSNENSVTSSDPQRTGTAPGISNELVGDLGERDSACPACVNESVGAAGRRGRRSSRRDPKPVSPGCWDQSREPIFRYHADQRGRPVLLGDALDDLRRGLRY